MPLLLLSRSFQESQPLVQVVIGVLDLHDSKDLGSCGYDELLAD